MNTLLNKELKLVLLWLLFPMLGMAQSGNWMSSKQIEKDNLLFIEGGTYNMGQDAEEDIVRRVTVSAFYIAPTEVTNKEYRAFINWLNKHNKSQVVAMLPDTSIWQRCVSKEVGEQLVNDYFRLPAFDYYPVVGVSWLQATAFTKWKSDRYNEQLAKTSGLWSSEMQEKYAFSTAEFLSGTYHKKEGIDFPNGHNLFLPNHRLLTEAEWEYAAWALIGKRLQNEDGYVANQQLVSTLTDGKEKHYKKEINQERKKALRHARKYPVPNYYNAEKHNLPKCVFEGDINAYGIFNMNGNVAEWVYDVYQPISKVVENIPKPITAPQSKDTQKTIPEDQMSVIETPWEEVVAKGKAAQSHLKVDANSLRVLKGAKSVNEKSPGNRKGAKAGGQQERLIGFRCGMTRVEPLE